MSSFQSQLVYRKLINFLACCFERVMFDGEQRAYFLNSESPCHFGWRRSADRPAVKQSLFRIPPMPPVRRSESREIHVNDPELAVIGLGFQVQDQVQHDPARRQFKVNI